MKKKKTKMYSVRVYGILDKKKDQIVKVGLDREEIQFDIDLDNIERNLILCEFDLRVELPY